MRQSDRYVKITVLLVAALTSHAASHAGDLVDGNLIQFNNNGAWSWFQDERAIVDPASGKILVSSVADGDGMGGTSRDGDIDVAQFDIATGRRNVTVVKNDYVVDDHNSAALWVRPDGRYVTMYAGHFTDNFSYYRVSTNPGDATSWSAEQAFNNGIGTTYSNLHYLPGDNGGQGRLYNFTRTINWDPNVLVSSDQGSSWSYGGKLLTQGSTGDRPYARYFSDGTRIHVLTTEEHPRDFNTSIYHGYIQDGVLYNSSGAVVDANILDSSGVSAPSLTTVFATNTSVGGASMQRTWTTDVAIDSNGHATAIFTARANGSDQDHRFFYATFNGTAWTVNEMAKAGGYLYAAENDYTGLAAIDPDDPDTVYMSTRIDPRNGQTTDHYEIYKGATANGGAAWQWQAITEGSTVDNIRPIVPKWDQSHTALLWLRGTYSTYTNYDMAVVGLVEQAGVTHGTMQYVDASTSNTTRASGTTAWVTAASSSMVADDNRWHERTGFGNNGQVFTADESGSEDAPLLVTTAQGVDAGEYDVWVYFWANVAEGWQIQAGLTSNSVTAFERQSSQHVLMDELNGAQIVEFISGSSEHALYRAYVGRTTVDASGLLRVFVNDGGGTTSTRTWYDGIGYAPLPEPSTLGAGAVLGALTLTRRTTASR